MSLKFIFLLFLFVFFFLSPTDTIFSHGYFFLSRNARNARSFFFIASRCFVSHRWHRSLWLFFFLFFWCAYFMLCIKYRSSDLHRLSPSECFCLPRITFFSHGDYFISQITFLSHGMHGTHGIFFLSLRDVLSLTETIFSHGDYFLSQITFLSHGMHGMHGVFFIASRCFVSHRWHRSLWFFFLFFWLLALLVILFTLGITQINLVSALAYYKIRLFYALHKISLLFSLTEATECTEDVLLRSPSI